MSDTVTPAEFFSSSAIEALRRVADVSAKIVADLDSETYKVETEELARAAHACHVLSAIALTNASQLLEMLRREEKLP